MKHEYTLRSLGASSAKFGPCELCNEHVSEMHIQTEFENCSDDGGKFVVHRGSAFGHRKCLMHARKESD